MKRKALGKGLRSLIPEAPPRTAVPTPPATQPARDGLKQIDIDRISPNREQPRQLFDDQSLEELAQSLKKDGVLQPIVVRPRDDGGFELVAGERRWRAAQIAGLLKIPAVVRDVSDDHLLELALIENLQREELNAIEAAQAFQTLVDELGLSHEEVAQRVGKQRATITNMLRLLNLVPEVQDLVRGGLLGAGHARAIAGLTRRADQIELAQRTVREGLSVRQVESLVAKGKGGPTTPREEKPQDPNVAAAAERLQSALQTRVRIVQRGKGGRLELHFHDQEELERVYQLILKAATRS
jgi:ParB family chromosome partitioning protein